jgi:hypothetical protein
VIRRALGNRDLLWAPAHSPAMLIYSITRPTIAVPNENYAANFSSFTLSIDGLC